MSLTVREALRIGSLVDAKVLAGANNLDRVVRFVDIIDVPDAAIWFRPDSLLSTTFYALKDNIEAQLKMIDDIVACGGAGLIIFSPDRYISAIDERLIQRAELRQLPLLQMPDSSYIDVIVPVMSAVLDKQVEALEYAQEIHRQMTNLVLRGKGQSEIISSLSALIKHPVLLADANFMFLDYAMPKEGAYNLSLMHSLTKHYGYLDLFDHYPKEVLDRISKEKGAFYHRSSKNSSTMDLMFPVVAGDNFYGIIIVPGLLEELIGAKTIALEAASTAIALEILKEKAIKDTEQKLKLDFFNELLLGNIKSRENIFAQAKRLGLELEGQYGVMLIEMNKDSGYYKRLLQSGAEISKEHLEEKLMRLVKMGLELENPGSIVTEALGSIVVLLRLVPQWDKGKKIEHCKKCMERIKNLIAERMKEAPICLAMGNIYDEIEKISTSYLEAWETLDLGKKLFHSRFTATYSDLEAYHLVKRLFTNTSAVNLYEKIYGKLLDYDKEKGGELVQTLETYIQSNYSRIKTAEKLHIHRNSLNYRLQKIQDIINIDIDQADSFPFLLASIARRLSN
ncbi:MAG: PucR family transcriptional regulator ligand-binding domain-containing protein [Bacillota bacterium]